VCHVCLAWGVGGCLLGSRVKPTTLNQHMLSFHCY
jgi:hypothetical protein